MKNGIYFGHIQGDNIIVSFCTHTYNFSLDNVSAI